MVRELIAEGMTEEEVVQVYVDNGFGETMARMIVAQELELEDADDRIELANG